MESQHDQSDAEFELSFSDGITQVIGGRTGGKGSEGLSNINLRGQGWGLVDQGFGILCVFTV